MVLFVPSCPRVHNSPASPAPFHVVAFRAAPDRSQLLLRGPHDGTGPSAHRHAMVVARALVDRHGPDVVVLLLGQAGEVLRRVSADQVGVAAAAPAVTCGGAA